MYKNFIDFIDNIKKSSMNVNINFMIIMSLLILCVIIPKTSDKFLELLDQPFVNLITILIISITLKCNLAAGILLSALYLFCIIQKRKNDSRKQYDTASTIVINSESKVEAAKDIIRESNVTNNDKKQMVSNIIDSKIPIKRKIRIVLVFLRHCPKHRLAVLSRLYNKISKQKNKVIMTKYIVKNKRNIPALIKSINKANMSSFDKSQILDKIPRKSILKKDRKSINEIIQRTETVSAPSSAPINDSDNDNNNDSMKLVEDDSNIIYNDSNIIYNDSNIIYND